MTDDVVDRALPKRGSRTLPRRRQLLALSGGGYRGLFSAIVLEELEAFAGKRLTHCFDLIAGTSVGGLLACAIAVEIPVRRVRETLEEHAGAIFPKVRAKKFKQIAGTLAHPRPRDRRVLDGCERHADLQRAYRRNDGRPDRNPRLAVAERSRVVRSYRLPAAVPGADARLKHRPAEAPERGSRRRWDAPSARRERSLLRSGHGDDSHRYFRVALSALARIVLPR
jgi:hypothetical protein